MRRLRFGGAERDRAGQSYIVALGIVARVLDHASGYSLRSRCDLISEGLIKIDIIDPVGTIKTQVVSVDDALGLLAQAEKEMNEDI